MGIMPEAERLPFAYAAYDPKDDVLVIAVGGTAKYPVVLRHLILHPTEVDVDGDSGGLKVVSTRTARPRSRTSIDRPGKRYAADAMVFPTSCP